MNGLIRFFRGASWQAGFSLSYLRRWFATPRAERLGLPMPRLHKLPICWARGHVYHGHSFVILSWRLQFCTCCGEEIAGRTRWDDIESRPDDIPEWEYGYEDDYA